MVGAMHFAWRFVLFQSKQSSYKIHLCRIYLSVFTHSTLALSRFFCKNVAFERFLENDFSCTGNFKALFCAAVCFYLWHYITCLLLLPAGAPKCRELMEPCGKCLKRLLFSERKNRGFYLIMCIN
jgi:thiamine transporter ThiT